MQSFRLPLFVDSWLVRTLNVPSDRGAAVWPKSVLGRRGRIRQRFLISLHEPGGPQRRSMTNFSGVPFNTMTVTRWAFQFVSRTSS